MADNISLTYEKLFDIARKEKLQEGLQKLDSTFYADLVAYLHDKSSVLSKDHQKSMFSQSENDISKKQLDNIKKLIVDLYVRREKKIINLAMMKSRTNSNLIDTSGLLNEEKELFKTTVDILNDVKKKVLFTVIAGNVPEVKVPNGMKVETHHEHEAVDALTVMFLNSVPKFVGKEMEEYGPFAKEQIVDLPAHVANILVNKGHAKKV
jgi:DNA replication initiation complex subunit (GINS family)